MGSLMLNGINYSGGEGSAVEPNPTGTPTATLNKLGIEGTIYGIEGSDGGGNVYGAFIDTNRVIQTETSVSSSDTYTATEDCMVIILLPIGNHNTCVYIDGVKVINMSGMTNTYYDYTTIPLKKGQVMTFDFGSTNGYITVYGLTFGTQNIFTPQIYSTEERCVGVWIDNKPLYCKTWDLQTVVTLPSGGYTLPNDIQTDLQNAEIIVSGFAIRSISNNATIPLTVYNANGVKSCLYIDSWGNVSKFTFYYTKTTDTAGSGSYNTLGVPMVHYSTNEQVIGTFEDEYGIVKPLYQRIIHTNDNNPIDVSSWNIGKVVKCEGEFTESLGSSYAFNIYAGDTYKAYIEYSFANNVIILFVGGWTTTKRHAVIQYTKTTD